MANLPYAPVIVAGVAVAILIFFPRVRRIVSLLVRIAITIVATGIAAFGLALLANNETIYEKPGIEARTVRFLSVSRATTSEKGLGSASCRWGDEPPAPAAQPSPKAGEEEDIYPELMQRGYPGIPRGRLFDVAQRTAGSLPGWKVVRADPRRGVIECTCSSRILGWQDQIRITVTPRSEIEVCSRNDPAPSGWAAWLSFFPGDLGTNVAHIKQFYETLEPQMDEVYKEEQERENAKKPGGAP